MTRPLSPRFIPRCRVSRVRDLQCRSRLVRANIRILLIPSARVLNRRSRSAAVPDPCKGSRPSDSRLDRLPRDGKSRENPPCDHDENQRCLWTPRWRVSRPWNPILPHCSRGSDSGPLSSVPLFLALPPLPLPPRSCTLSSGASPPFPPLRGGGRTCQVVARKLSSC